MKEKVKCSVCGKEVFKECMFINVETYMDYSMFGDLKKSLGPYAGSDYRICYECWLNRMGIPVPAKKEEMLSPLKDAV
jgi:hypothetical protein